MTTNGHGTTGESVARSVARSYTRCAVKRVSVLRAGQRLEHASLRIADRQQSGADCEIGGMQLQLALLDERAYARKRHQVLKRRHHRLLFERGVILVIASKSLAAAERPRGRRNQFHPFADEIAGRQRLHAFRIGADAAAMAVAEHDDVLYPERDDGKLKCR